MRIARGAAGCAKSEAVDVDGEGADALFVRRGDEYVATELTQGPWNPEHQHGGP